MKMKWRHFAAAGAVAALASLSLASEGRADVAKMVDYCVTPSFLAQNTIPNLLLMIDNSASMFDLAYSDTGQTDGSGTVTRQPYYCYDETYNSSNTYVGYFDPGTYYQYRSGTDDFAAVAGFPNGCPTSAANTTKTIADTLCVEYLPNKSALVSFVASGNYLNWIASSKFDVEKMILTGGKYDGSSLLAESRGCVGQGYVKDAITADFENFSGTNDPNDSLGVTFTVRGPANATSASSPSPGGQTYIDLFAGDTPYDYGACQDAINALSSGNNSEIKQSVASCLSSSSPTLGYCQQPPQSSCATSTECMRNTSFAQSSYVCSLNTGLSCLGSTDATTCTPPARDVCQNLQSRSCSVNNDCNVSSTTTIGTCTGWTPELPNGVRGVPTTCTVSSDCTVTKKTTTYNGTCTGYVPATTTYYGPCVNVAPNYGTCVANYFGPCVLPGTAVATKTKVSFQQSMQACWQLRNGHAIGTDEINTVKNQCSDVFGGLYTCSNNHDKTCSGTSDVTTCGAGNTCVGGPAAIAPGNPALLCGTSYEGQFYSLVGGAWTLMAGNPTPLPAACAAGDSQETCMEKVHTQFCNDLSTPNVTDPTDSPSDTATYDNLPAIISGIGVEAQMGAPVATMRVKVATSEPTGLVQEFGGKIRFGAMDFNYNGSAAEVTAGLLATPKVCSNNLTKACATSTDCGSGNSCIATVSGTTNLDGGSIVYPIGKGHCSTTTSTVCTTNNNCPSGETCVSDGVGDHTTGLVNTIDNIRAATWTPFAEAYYNAIGYFAVRPGTSPPTSRTDLRLNSADYDATLNPSQYRCQKNFTLLVTDGSSTQDRNGTMDAFARLYAPAAGKPSGWDSTCSYYNGSKDLPLLSWIANNRNISTVSTSSASTAPPANARDRIGTYVVLNGQSNGQSGECNSLTMLNDTATNGGTTLRQANNPSLLSQAIRSVFEELAAQTASGTAASILSNSQGSGANILQAVFYPKKVFDGSTQALWIGEMQNLWYFIDPFLGNSSVREDTGYTSGDHLLNLKNNYVVDFFFDNQNPSSPTYNQTMVRRSQDTDGNGTGDTLIGTVAPDAVNSIWRAGRQLWARSSARTVYTPCLTGGTCLSNNLMRFSTGNDTALQPYLQAAGATEADDLINYVLGTDKDGYRGRTVTIGGSSRVWKLGDIISSTPRLQSSVELNTYDLGAPSGYGDASYSSYIGSSSYANRGMAYVGANDGMLHAFKMGKLDVTASGFQKATLSGNGLGEEQWAYVPSQALPYLRYLTCASGSSDAYCASAEYGHLYYVDGTTTVVDASIGNPSGCGGDYWDCAKDTAAGTNWRSVLIGGMGIGGASRDRNDGCSEDAAGTCVKSPIAGSGYSSYFALDITNQTYDASGNLVQAPRLMWEFNDPNGLGFATTGAAIVRIKARTGGSPDPNKNGKWFAVFGSGPTGPIDKTLHQFKGTSNQQLKIYVVDLNATPPFTLNTNYWVIGTLADGSTLANAFVASMTNATIDTDRWNPSAAGNYQDDALYFGYVEQGSGTPWSAGGVLRLMTHEDPNPANWTLSKVIGGIGPVTTGISRLQDKKNHALWLYFGTGRYFYSQDDLHGGQTIYGLSDPCYTASDTLNPSCSTTIPEPSTINNLLPNHLTDQSSTGSTSVSSYGWYINLDAEDTGNTLGAERVVTDPVALTNGAVFFTTFKPSADLCNFGGNSYLWATKYNTGLQPPATALEGKALVQVSTGAFQQVDLSTAFTDRGGRKMLNAMTGKPPTDPPPIVTKSNLKPVKKIIQIRER